MLIYYWCPFLTKIATIKSVINSISSFHKYNFLRKKIDIKIINSCGEWDEELNENNFDFLRLSKLNFHKILPKKGLLSRLSLFIISAYSFIPLLYFVKKHKPNFLVIHLLTALPIFLSNFWGNKTKIILRISGLPRLNFFRKILWKYLGNKIYLVTTPTTLTRNFLIKNNIFNERKIKVLRDPIINCKKINFLKNEKINDKLTSQNYYIAVGRLTNQKNFNFLINSFSKICQNLKTKRLIIIGDGEQREDLKKLIKINKMENSIYLMGYKKNAYKYIHNSQALISTSNYEDPGFVLYESVFLNKAIISSICDNGPRELYEVGKTGYFFKKNDFEDFKKNILDFENNDNFNLKLNSKKFCKNFTLFRHNLLFNKLLD